MFFLQPPFDSPSTTYNMDPAIWQYHSCEFCQTTTIDLENNRDPVTGDEVDVIYWDQLEEYSIADGCWFFLGPTLEALLAARHSCIFADKLISRSWHDERSGEDVNRLPDGLGHLRLVVTVDRSSSHTPQFLRDFCLCGPDLNGTSWIIQFSKKQQVEISFLTTRSTPSKLILRCSSPTGWACR